MVVGVALPDAADIIMQVTIQRNAARDAAETLADRYGATVEWDDEGMPSMTMPEPKGTEQ